MKKSEIKPWHYYIENLLGTGRNPGLEPGGQLVWPGNAPRMRADMRADTA